MSIAGFDADLTGLICFPAGPTVRDSRSTEVDYVSVYLGVTAERSHLVRQGSWACFGCWQIHSSTSLPRPLRTVRVHSVPASTVLGVHRGRDGRYCALYIAYMVAPIYGSDQQKLIQISSLQWQPAA